MCYNGNHGGGATRGALRTVIIREERMNSGAIGAHKRGGVDMTEGSIFRHLLRFAFPLLVGSVFQQLYNTVDTWVVGNYVGDNAFSAVGTVGPIINMLIGFFLGLSSG
ncbi:MAG: MATE family efflux transporter, partial [Eubacteriales bacterium]